MIVPISPHEFRSCFLDIAPQKRGNGCWHDSLPMGFGLVHFGLGQPGTCLTARFHELTALRSDAVGFLRISSPIKAS